MTPGRLTWPRVRTLADLDSLDPDDMAEGFRDGYADAPEPQPGGNRSRAYWHGWRNGMMDKGRIPIDDVHRTLVGAYVDRVLTSNGGGGGMARKERRGIGP